MCSTPFLLLGLAPVAAAASACGWPFDCESVHVEVAFDATSERGAERDEREAFGAVAPGNLGPDYEIVEAVLVGDSHRSATWVTWTLYFADAAGGYVAFTVGGPFEVGAVQPLGHGDSVGWGVGPVLATDQAGIRVLTGDFVSESASGTLEVLGVEPLRFGVDVELSGERKETLRLKGEMEFVRVVTDTACE